MDHGYAFGIDEEYFVADARTGGSADAAQSERFHAVALAALEQAEHELLKGQIEYVSKPTENADEACDRLRAARRALAGLAREHSLSLIAAGSQPLGSFDRQSTTDKARYKQLEAQFGLIAHRSMCCALHVHVEVPPEQDRVRLMHRLVPFLPLFLALSTSSPYWDGEDAGLKCMRLAVFSEWPRMGLPEAFADEAELDRFVGRLVDVGNMENASFLWWLIRPSSKYPTLELRICDCCTRVEDAVAIASLYRCLVRAMTRQTDVAFNAMERAIARENIWQAQRGGTHARFLDAKTGALKSVADTLDAAAALCEQDAVALGCVEWIVRAKSIAVSGSSADRQLDAFADAQVASADTDTAMRAVVAHLAAETIA